MPKYLKITKAVLYITAGILIFVFYHNIMMCNSVAFLVGGVVLVYTMEEVLFHISHHQFSGLAFCLIQSILAALLFLSYDDLKKVCIIWGVWAIIREGRELTRAFEHIKKRRLAVLDIIESVAVTALSVILVISPEFEHAQTHLIILGVELILEVAFPLAEELLQRKKEKKG